MRGQEGLLVKSQRGRKAETDEGDLLLAADLFGQFQPGATVVHRALELRLPARSRGPHQAHLHALLAEAAVVEHEKDEGIRWNWQRVLGIGTDIVGDEYPYLVTQMEPTTLGALTQQVLAVIEPLGQNGVLVIGDLQKKVNRVATGTGVSVDPLKMMELGADVGILTDDYYLHVRMGELARELDFPAIVVNHGVAEERGIEALARYVTRAFPAAEVFHLPQRCPYRVVTA